MTLYSLPGSIATEEASSVAKFNVNNSFSEKVEVFNVFIIFDAIEIKLIVHNERRLVLFNRKLLLY